MAERLLDLEAAFEGLNAFNYEKTSERDPVYNCIAFAGGDRTQRWDDPRLGYYWHPKALVDDVYYALESLYSLECGYCRCDDGTLEPGFEKIAIYANGRDVWTHAAHQLPNGEWESKCGYEEDIRHSTPAAMEGVQYGHVKQYMKRPIKDTANGPETSTASEQEADCDTE